MSLKVEYLIIIDSQKSFCRDKKAFDNLMRSNADLTIESDLIRYKNLEVGYEVQFGETTTEGKKNRFLHIKLKCDRSKNIEEFEELLREARQILYLASDTKPQILWDDISFYYSQKAYPLIHEIENLVRKLITKFMLTNVGLGWTKEAIPEELKKSSKTDKINDNNNYLYEIDFIQLSNFLFDEYRTLEIKTLIDKLKRIDGGEENYSLSDLKGFIPRSNWERYFQQHVDCEAAYIQTKWEKLYKLRCKIAHNNSFSKADLDRVASLVNDVKPKIEAAINTLDKVEVPEDEREELAENVATNISLLHADYIHKWNKLEQSLHFLALDCGLFDANKKPTKKRPLEGIITDLVRMNILENQSANDIITMNALRNALVHRHGSKPPFSDRHIATSIEKLNHIIKDISNLS